MQKRLASAKTNLALHVIGQRDDGYHLLDSLVTFTDFGDVLTFEAASSLSLLESGPFGVQLALETDSNLVLRACDLLIQYFEKEGRAAPAAALTLEKNMPLASGIGGGSADAAAALLGLNALALEPAPESVLDRIALELGADVPVCLRGIPARIEGIGERIEPVSLPSFPIVLANPGVCVPTPVVFSQLKSKQNGQLDVFPKDRDRGGWIDWMSGQRNDLQIPAQEIAPEITTCLSLIENTDACQLARMSGSGATCFGLYPSKDLADQAAAEISATRPDWWVVSTSTLG